MDDQNLNSSYDPLQWQKIFSALVDMLRTQQTQLETLAKEREILHDRVQLQHNRWVFDVQILQERLSEMESAVSEAEMGHILEKAKLDLVVGMKHKEGFLYKLKSVCGESDLQDLQLWMDYLIRKHLEQKAFLDKSEAKSKKVDRGDDDLKTVETSNKDRDQKREIRRLKRECEKLVSEKKTEVSALLDENKFVWNQLRKTESDYTSLLKGKRIEIEQANENIEKLQVIMENLHSSNKEKDEIIAKLKTDLAKLEMDVDNRSKEIFKSSRNSRTASVTPVVSCCRGRSKENRGRNQKRYRVDKESTGFQSSDSANTEKGYRRRSKRRASETIVNSETPKLFSSSFKVPKLKSSSLAPL